MKQLIYITLILSALVSCQSKNSDETKSDKVTETQIEKIDSVQDNPIQMITANEEDDKTIFIKDSSDYSAHFLKEMESLGMNNIQLIDNLLILEQADTVIFPEIPKVGRKTILTAKQDELAIALTIERINQTTIDYEIEMVEFGKTTYDYTGQADLNPRFYYGSETDESSLSGLSYLSTEFKDHQDSCYTYIRLGKEDKSGPYLLGKIKKNCNGEIMMIGLDTFPTLVEK